MVDINWIMDRKVVDIPPVGILKGTKADLDVEENQGMVEQAGRTGRTRMAEVEREKPAGPRFRSKRSKINSY